MYKLAANVLSPAGRRARLSILIYHRVLRQPDPLFPDEVDARLFDWQMKSLAQGFNVLRLSDAVQRLRAGTLPPRAACITFDDGYADNADVALPILQKYALPCTFFIATGFLDGGRMWNDTLIEAVRNTPKPVLQLEHLGFGSYATGSIEERRTTIGSLLNSFKYLPLAERLEKVARVAETADCKLPDNLMLRSEQVRTLNDAGMEIGAHTVNHPILTRISDEAVEAEIVQSKHALEALIQAPVRLFAYPNGRPRQDYAAQHVAIVRKLGFSAAVATAWGAATEQSDSYQLPRFTPWDKSAVRFKLRLLQNLRRGASETV